MDNSESDGQANPLRKLPIQVSVRVCGRSISVDQFLDWIPGTILSFDQRVTSPLAMCIGSCTVGEGQAVKVGSKMGLRLSRIGELPIVDATLIETR